MDLPGGGFCGFGCFSGLWVGLLSWFTWVLILLVWLFWIFVGGFVELR